MATNPLIRTTRTTRPTSTTSIHWSRKPHTSASKRSAPIVHEYGRVSVTSFRMGEVFSGGTGHDPTAQSENPKGADRFVGSCGFADARYGRSCGRRSNDLRFQLSTEDRCDGRLFAAGGHLLG